MVEPEPDVTEVVISELEFEAESKIVVAAPVVVLLEDPLLLLVLGGNGEGRGGEGGAGAAGTTTSFGLVPKKEGESDVPASATYTPSSKDFPTLNVTSPPSWLKTTVWTSMIVRVGAVSNKYI